MSLWYRHATVMSVWGILFMGLFIFQADAAYDTIAGPLPRVVSAENSPYLVIEDIEVPLGKTVTIEPGTVFLFRNFAGMHVQGRLVAKGTKSHPVVFTSEFDRSHNESGTMLANPYDWNGIYIHENALGSSLSHCQIHFSVYGIISETKFFRIDSGLFRNNGKSDLVIEGLNKTVGDEPYSYSLTVKDATVDGVPVRILRDPMAPKRNVVRYSSLVGIIGGAALGVISTLQWQESQKELDKLSEENGEKGTANLVYNQNDDWVSTRDRRNKNIALSAAGYSLFLLGSVGLSFSFTF